LIKGGGGKTSDTKATTTGINRGEAAFNSGIELRRIQLGRKQFIQNTIANNNYPDEKTAKYEADKAHRKIEREAEKLLVSTLKNPPQHSIYTPLAVDFDRQASLTHSYGLQKNTLPTLYHVLKGEVSIHEAIVQTPQGFILPGGASLSYLANTGMDYLAVVRSFRPIIDQIKRFFFPIVIDTSASENDIANDIALAVADGVIIPTNAEEFDKEGVVDALGKINRIRDLNPNLEVLGVLLNRFGETDIVNQDVLADIKDDVAKHGTTVFDTYIRECTTVRKAHRVRQSIFDYDEEGATATADYLTFIKELLDKNERLRCPKLKN